MVNPRGNVRQSLIQKPPHKSSKSIIASVHGLRLLKLVIKESGLGVVSAIQCNNSTKHLNRDAIPSTPHLLTGMVYLLLRTSHIIRSQGKGFIGNWWNVFVQFRLISIFGIV